MERSGDSIIHNLAEQESLSQPPEITAEQAIHNAREFDAVADSLNEQVLALSGEEDLDGGQLDPAVVADIARKTVRASELRRYVNNVQKLCAPEIIAKTVGALTQD